MQFFLCQALSKETDPQGSRAPVLVCCCFIQKLTADLLYLENPVLHRVRPPNNKLLDNTFIQEHCSKTTFSYSFDTTTSSKRMEIEATARDINWPASQQTSPAIILSDSPSVLRDDASRIAGQTIRIVDLLLDMDLLPMTC